MTSPQDILYSDHTLARLISIIIKNIFLVCLMAVFTVISCSKQQDDLPAIVTVRSESISTDTFRESFNLYPQYRPNSSYRDAMLTHLDKMADQLYRYMAARQARFDTLESIKQQHRYILNREMLKKLYQSEVLDQIPVSAADAWDEYKKQNLAVAVRHLFSKDKEGAMRIYLELQQGKDFKTIAAGTFDDSLLAANGGYLGFIKLTDFDPLLVDSLYNLKIGSYSRPLQSRYGYHIFKVEDVKQAVFLDKEYFERNIEDFRQALQNRRALLESALFIKKTLRGKALDIRTKTLRQLAEITRSYIADRDEQVMMLYPKITDGEIYLVRNAAELITDSLLVQFDGNSWTVEQFISRLKGMPPSHRPQINNEKILAKTIIDLVRDELLLQEAYDLKLDENEIVKRQTEKHYTQILAEAFGNSLMLSAVKDADPQGWEERKNLLLSLKNSYPAKVDSILLFKNIPEQQLQKKMPLIKVVLQQQYRW